MESAFAVDVGDLELHHLPDAQAGGIRDGQRRLAPEVGRGSNQARHFVAAQHDGQHLRHVHRLHPGYQLAVAQRDIEEELQADDVALIVMGDVP